MTVYLDLVILLDFLVDGLLLMGANRLTGHPPGWQRCMAAAAAGGVYAGVCMLPQCRFLGNLFWRMICLGGMAGIAYGWNVSALRRGAIFVLLSMALGGVAIGLGQGNFISLILAAVGIACLCMLGIRSPLGMDKYQMVELKWKGRCIKLTALVDTGNGLRDPITGSGVLIVGADIGERLGISREMIQDPITTLCEKRIPGARLIPYRAVGRPGGMLLLLRLETVKLNGKHISPMVAFAPDEIGKQEGYQALAGGTL